MFITTDQMSLRLAEPQDSDLIYRWENDRSVWRVSETIAPTSHFQIDQFLLGNNDLLSNRQLRLMIEVHGEPHPIGTIDLFEYDPVNQRIGIGILIDQAYRNLGYATSALGMTLTYLFKDLMVHQVHCLIDELNLESQRLFEHAGFVKVGKLSDWIRVPQGFIDVFQYQLINQP